LTNNIAVSVTADVQDLVAKRAVMSAELKAATADLNNFARTAAKSGTTAELQTGMLGAADRAEKLRNQIKLVDAELKTLRAGSGLATVAGDAGQATQAMGGLQHGSAGVTRELIVMGREASRGNFSRMAGSATILAGKLGLIEAALTPVGLAIAAVAAVEIAATVATAQYEAEQQKLIATTIGLGAASGLTGEQLQQSAVQAAKASGQSVSASLASAEAFAGAGVRSQGTIRQLSADVQTFAALVGQKAADAQKTLADAMKDPTKGAEELNSKLDILDSTQLQQIKTAQAAGDQEKADAILLQALQKRIDEARGAGVGLNGEFGQLASGASNFWSWLGKVNEQLTLFNELGFASGRVQAQAQANAASAAAKASAEAQLNKASAGGAEAFAKTPEGEDAAKRNELAEGLSKAKGALEADTKLHGANSDAVKQDRQTVADYTRAVTTYVGEAQKKTEIDALDVKITEARHAHNKALIEDLTTQKALLSQAGVVESAADAAALSKGSGDVAGAKGAGGAKPKNDEVQILEQQLQTQLEDKKDYFADSKADELRFWTESLAQTRLSAEEQRQVKTKIYGLDREMAQQAYQEQIALSNDRIEADRGDWSRQQADWVAKLVYIESFYKQESTEYQNAYREYEAAERTHEASMAQIKRDAEKQALDQLKESLTTAKTIRDEDAKTQESLINANAGAGPIGAIQAAMQVAELKKQLNAQDLADTEATYQAEDALREQAIARAIASYTADSTQAQSAVDAKIAADQAYYDKRRIMEDQATQQSIRDAQEIQSKWMGVTQPIGSAFTSMFQGMYSRQETFAQAAAKAGDQLLFKLIDVAVEDLEKWGATQLAKSGIIKAQAAIQGAAQTTAASGAAIAQKAADEAAVTGYAGEAAAATFAAYSPLSMVDPGIPATMAAAAFAQTISFGSFSKGLDTVPRDMIALVHAGEKIMPASDNAAIREAVKGNASGNAGARGGAQTINNHYSPTINAPAQSGISGMLEDHGHELLTWLGKQQRKGRI